jgi:ABC-2 type transport system ATP-binding protein
MTDHAIRIRGLRKQYRGFALKDVDLDVPRGYVTGLIGPNGAGKTTLVKLIMNLVRRDAGTVTVLGLDNLADEVAVKSRIGFIYDEPPFYHDVSLRDQARAIAPFYPGWSDARFRELAGQFGLPLGKRFKALSHGTKMKFALAVALSHDADLLIMDEPTAGLDLEFRRELLDQLTSTLQDAKKSVLFSTHITSDLERVADYVTFIRDGAIVFTLPKDELRDRWGIVRTDRRGADRLPAAILRGRRERPHGVEVLVADAAAARAALGADAVIDRASFDEVMVLMHHGGEHAHAA